MSLVDVREGITPLLQTVRCSFETLSCAISEHLAASEPEDLAMPLTVFAGMIATSIDMIARVSERE